MKRVQLIGKLMTVFGLVLLALICLFGVLNHYVTSRDLIPELAAIAYADNLVRAYWFGIIIVIVLAIAAISRFLHQKFGRPTSVITIAEEGGTTSILESAVNQYLQAVLTSVDGVDSTNTTVHKSSAGAAVAVNIAVETRNVKPRAALSDDIRAIAHDALKNALGISDIDAIDIKFHRYSYADESPPAPAPKRRSPRESLPASAAESAESADEPDRSSARDRGWFGSRSSSSRESWISDERESVKLEVDDDSGEDFENPADEAAVVETEIVPDDDVSGADAPKSAAENDADNAEKV